jgi:ATP-dependent DNA helicase RecQ
MWDGITLVVSPLIALMKDQIGFLRDRGISAARMDSSLTAEEARAANEQLRSGKLKLLYVAPERFNNERFLETIRRNKVALFAIDEAHCISEWGHNFRPDYLKLAEIVKDLKVERVLALTATATPAVVENICGRFGIPKNCAVVTGFYRSNLVIWTTPVAGSERDRLLLDRLNGREPGATIIYVTLQKTAERVAAMLDRAGHPARPYHAGMEAAERTDVQEWWMSSDRNIVVATIAFGMGIDKANVRYVYHYNLPKSLESYSQEIGRAGRDGAPSTVELFACAEDVPTLENFLQYFGETREAPCGHCTWCRTGQPRRLPVPQPLPPLPGDLNAAIFASMRNEYRDALGDPRQAARFLCGLTSPALTRHKLTRHSMFGIFEDRRFADVLKWCEASSSSRLPANRVDWSGHFPGPRRR